MRYVTAAVLAPLALIEIVFRLLLTAVLMISIIGGIFMVESGARLWEPILPSLIEKVLAS